MVELNLDRLPIGRSWLELDHELVREDQILQGHRVEGFSTRVSGELIVDAMDQKVLVHGEFTARRTMSCHRSGEPFELAYPVSLEVLVYRLPGRGGAEEIENDDNWVIHQPSGPVDLTDALLEAVVLDEPQHVVHPDYVDARLPGVGESGEETGESEGSDPIDPRWEALRKLREGGGSRADD
jgi:uncharacterized metal-binding protein YceD (DUF177 family)